MRLKSRYKIDTVDLVILRAEPGPPPLPERDKELEPPPQHCRAVEQRIQKKHEAYRQRFKKWRRFVDVEEKPSPLEVPIEDEEEEEHDYRDYSGPASSDEEDDDFISHDERVSGNTGSDGDHPEDVRVELEMRTMERTGRTQNSMSQDDR
jgi:hypothetical protein